MPNGEALVLLTCWIPLPSDGKKDRENILSSGRSITEALRRQNKVVASTELMDETFLRSRFPANEGAIWCSKRGFGAAPKFPMGHGLSFYCGIINGVISRSFGNGQKNFDGYGQRRHLDHLGGGFHRYSTTNFGMCRILRKCFMTRLYYPSVTWKLIKLPVRWVRSSSQDIFDYVLRDMTDKEGGFYSAEDADSIGSAGPINDSTGGHLKEEHSMFLIDRDRWCFRQELGVGL